MKFVLNLLMFLVAETCVLSVGAYAYQFKEDGFIIALTLIAFVVLFIQFIWRVISCVLESPNAN